MLAPAAFSAGGQAVMRINWRTLAAVLAFAALWWSLLLAGRCDGGRPRPTELVPPEQVVGVLLAEMLATPGGKHVGPTLPAPAAGQAMRAYRFLA